MECNTKKFIGVYIRFLRKMSEYSLKYFYFDAGDCQKVKTNVPYQLQRCRYAVNLR